MGLSFGLNSSGSDREVVYRDRVVKVPANPNPRNFTILADWTFNEYTVLKIQYPDATNFEGTKLLMFSRGVTRRDVELQGWIDPHFSNEKGIYPVARFEPSPQGMELAFQCAVNS